MCVKTQGGEAWNTRVRGLLGEIKKGKREFQKRKLKVGEKKGMNEADLERSKFVKVSGIEG